ncbi:unnamed protein product [Discosporangium mesarthrocarpum]
MGSTRAREGCIHPGDRPEHGSKPCAVLPLPHHLREQEPKDHRQGEGQGQAGIQFSDRLDLEKERRASATHELVKQFQTGSAVTALRAELKQSRSSMKQSADALRQAAAQWNQHNSSLS